MQNFDVYFPTHIYFGKDRHLEVGKLIKAEGAKKVLIHYGGKSAERTGLLQTVRDLLTAEGLEYVELGGQKPNAALSIMRVGIDLCLKEKVDFILAVGGGSVIDSAKTIALGVEDPSVDVWQYYLRKAVPVPHPENHVKLGVILTISGAGSDAIPGTNIVNDEVDPPQKLEFWDEIMRPVFDILNPEFLFTVPQYFMKCAAIDVVQHLLEGYFSHVAVKGNEITDRTTEAYMKVMIKAMREFFPDQKNYDAASEIMWAATSGHTFICRPGNVGDGATHRIGHMIGGIYNKIHGETLTAGWAYWAQYVMDTDYERFINLGKYVWDIPDDGRENRRSLAMETVDAFLKFYEEMGLPTTYGQLMGRVFTQEEVDMLAFETAKCQRPVEKYIGGFRKLYEDDIRKIILSANHM